MGLFDLGGLLTRTHTAGQYRAKQTDYLDDLDGLSRKYGQNADKAESGYDEFDPAYRDSLRNLTTYLKQDPFSSQQDAAYLNQATTGAADAYTNADARLTANLTKRFGSAQNAPSLLAGGLADIEAGRAKTQAQAASNLAYKKIDTRRANLNQLVSVNGGAASNYLNQENADLSHEGSLDNLLESIFGHQADVAQARDDANNGGFGQLLGTVGQVAGGFDWSHILGGKKKSNASTSGNPYGAGLDYPNWNGAY